MRILLFIVLILSSLHISGQVINESAIRAELQKRNIDEQKFKDELLKRGIDITKIDPTNTKELARIESEVKAVADMLEKANKNQPVSGSSLDAVNKVVEQKEQAIKKQMEEADTKQNPNSSNEAQSGEGKDSKKEGGFSNNLQDKQKDQMPEPITFGQQIFKDNSLKLFRTAEDAKPPKTYVLGPGDVVSISIFGASKINFAKEINKDGYIQPDRLPRYYLAGLTLEQAEKLLMKSIRNYALFSSEEFQFTVTTARTLNVNIFGEVYNNGSFNISAYNTAFNALVAAGGPTDLGSVRKIKLLRPGQKPKTIDVYQFLNDPAISQEFYLQENDYIQVPAAEKLVTIYGAVNRPYRYELLDNENLNALIKYAAGLLPNAVRRNIQVTRVENDKATIIDINYNDLLTKKTDFDLKNGDIIKVNALNQDVKNIVSIEGAVEESGDYSFEEGMKLSDLLSKTKLLENAIKETAYLKRLNDDLITVRYELVNITSALKNPMSQENIPLKKGDVLTIRALADFKETKELKIDGAVRKPGKYAQGDNSLKVSDVLFLSGGLDEKAAAFGYLFRNKNGFEKTQEYVYIDLAKIIKNPNDQANLVLQPNDSLYIYYSETFMDKSFVKVSGAVRNPTEILFNPSLSVKDVLLMAGGLKQEASTNRIDVYRLNFGDEKKTSTLAARLSLTDDTDLSKAADFKIQPNDIIIVREAPEYELQRTVSVVGEVTYPGEYALIKENTNLVDIVEMAGGTTLEAYLDGATLYRREDSLGFIVINLKEALKNKKSSHNIILQQSDILEIPKQNDIVSIIGASNYDELYPDKLTKNGKINVAYESNKNAMYYINNFAGGLDVNADAKRITVQHKNGKIEKVKKFLFVKIYPKVKEGSVINIPYKKLKTEAEKKEQKDIDWGDVLKNSITQATAILSLILLVRSVD